MNKNLLFNIYKDDIHTGSLVLKAAGQHYKISGLRKVLILAAGIEQFCRSVEAGAQPRCSFSLYDLDDKGYELNLEFLNRKTCLKLLLETVAGPKHLLFDWEGGFAVFRLGFQVF